MNPHYQPALDVQTFPQPLDVGGQVRGLVSGKVGLGLARVGTTPAAVSLIEEHDTIRRIIEESAMPRRTSGPRAPVDVQGRFTARIATGLPVDVVAVADIQHAMFVRIYFRIQTVHGIRLPGLLQKQAATVDGQGNSSHVTIPHQEQDRVRDVLRFAYSSDRKARGFLGDHRLAPVSHQLADERRIN